MGGAARGGRRVNRVIEGRHIDIQKDLRVGQWEGGWREVMNPRKTTAPSPLSLVRSSFVQTSHNALSGLLKHMYGDF